MDAPAKARLKFTFGFASYFLALFLLWNTVLVYPLKVFVVLLHEISHGLAAIATGGSIDKIVIGADQGGACYCPGGNAFLTLSAGYLGSMAWGAFILSLARLREDGLRWATAAIGVLVASVTLLYVRNLFGFAFGAAFGGALVFAGRKLPAQGVAGTLTALGLTSCLYAILDIKSDIIDRPEVMSDARMLSEMTGVPTIVWGVLWIIVALGVGYWLLKLGFRAAGRARRGGEILPASHTTIDDS